MSNIKFRSAYFSPTGASIAVTPTWTLLGTIPFAIFQLILNGDTTSSIEYSLDGVNPFVFCQAGAVSVPSAIILNLKAMDLVIPKGATLFARRTTAAAAGSLRVTAIGSSSATFP